MPAAGTGLTLTPTLNIRYCAFQRVRIEAARPLVQAGTRRVSA